MCVQVDGRHETCYEKIRIPNTFKRPDETLTRLRRMCVYLINHELMSTAYWPTGKNGNVPIQV